MKVEDLQIQIYDKSFKPNKNLMKQQLPLYQLDVKLASIDSRLEINDSGKLFKKYGFKHLVLKQRYTKENELVCNKANPAALAKRVY